MSRGSSHRPYVPIVVGSLFIMLTGSCDFLSGYLPGDVRLEIICETLYSNAQGKPGISCTVRNTGTRTSYRECVIYTAFRGAVAVDTLRVLQVTQKDIPPGGEAVLDGTFYRLKNHSEYDRLERRIVWLDR